MQEILHPDRFRYQFLRMLMAEGVIDEPHSLAAVVDHVVTEYEKDWSRCVATCYDLERDAERFVRTHATN